MSDPILITGGTGKTGRRVTSRLREAGHAVRVASRTGDGSDAVAFDWSDPRTFPAATNGATAIYLVAPPGDPDALGAMRPAIDAALAAGVRRFVLLSASTLEADGAMMGQVHAYLRDHAPEWSVLRPSWFMQNFSEQQHLPTILEESAIYTATGQGRVGFIDAGDIAAVAVILLTSETIEHRDHILTGPEAISYDDVAAKLSDVSGRKIVHKALSVEALTERFVGYGIPEDFATGLAYMDEAIAQGTEDRITDSVERITGCRPASFGDFADANQMVWQINQG